VAAAGIGDVDLAVLDGEARREPFLPLAAIAALPGAAGRKILSDKMLSSTSSRDLLRTHAA